MIVLGALLCYYHGNMGAFLGLGERWKKPEQRKYPRVPVKFPVEHKLGETTRRTHASMLGGGGLFIEDTEPLPRDAEIVVRFRPAKHLPYLRAKARVIYTLPDRGSGIEFIKISQKHQQLILRLIHHKTADRRKHPRVPMATQIHIKNSMALAFSRDVSVGGLFVETKAPSHVGTRIDLRFHLNDGGPIVIAAGEVCYTVPKMGMGVQFLELTRVDRKRIEALVASSPTVLPEPAPTASPAS